MQEVLTDTLWTGFRGFRLKIYFSLLPWKSSLWKVLFLCKIVLKYCFTPNKYRVVWFGKYSSHHCYLMPIRIGTNCTLSERLWISFFVFFGSWWILGFPDAILTLVCQWLLRELWFHLLLHTFVGESFQYSLVSKQKVKINWMSKMMRAFPSFF